MSARTTADDWEASFAKEVKMIRLASTEGNYTFLALYQEKQMAAIAAEAATAHNDLTAMDAATMYEVTDVYQKLQDNCDAAIKENEARCAETTKLMQELKEKTDVSQEDWIKLISDEADKQKAENAKRWDKLNDDGIKNIKKMPAWARATAASTYQLGLSTVGGLAATVVNWLKDGLNKVSEFLTKAWEKIKEFGKNVIEWVAGARDKVVGIFKGIFSYSASDLHVQKKSQFGEFGAFSAGPDSGSGVTLE